MKLRSSTKLLIGLVCLVGAGWGGWQLFAISQIGRYQFAEIPPGPVSLIAVRPGSGYRIIVANSVAQLAEGSDNFETPEAREDEDTTNKRRIPIREMLSALQGDEEALSKFTMVLNKMSENDLPAVRVLWNTEDIEKALDGNEELKAKLESDLNVTLEGSPLEQINPSSLENGIVLEYRVPVKVKVGAEVKTLNAMLMEQFRPSFAAKVHDRYKEHSTIDAATIRGNYLDEALAVKEGRQSKQNVAEALRDRFSESRLKILANAPERVLSNTTVVLTGDQLVSAEVYKEDSPDNRDRFTMSIQLTQDGRMRLWKYSRENPGFQLLLTVNGVAVAAPRIGSELITDRVSINRLTDERLARQTADTISKKSPREKKS